MPLIHTNQLQPNRPLRETRQVYCGLDTMLTYEVLERIREVPRAQSANVELIYGFERALQAPYMEIMLRGFRVDEISRRDAIAALTRRYDRLDQILQRYAYAVWDKRLNPRSSQQLKSFFYEKMRLPEQWISQKGQRKLSMNRESLEKLETYFYARPVVAVILAMRDIAKQLETLRTEVDPDGRMRTSYNIAGTNSGRPSSSANAFGTGGNLQNITPSLRYVFVADPGWKLCVIDLEQTEARDVGFLCGLLFDDWSFLDNCESGDLHTNNARLIWNELGWPSEPTKARQMADQIFYRDFSYRDFAKRGGHLSHYRGTAWTASRHLKVPVVLMEEFHQRYLLGPDAAFPCIPRYWQWVEECLQRDQLIITPYGRERHFFGRPRDETTIREAIAFTPQSLTADRMNLGLWRLWKKLGHRIQLLGQTYDSVTFQYREEEESEIISLALELIKVPLVARGRTYIVPGEAKVGWNWGSEVSEADRERALALGQKPPRLNPGGLRKYKGAKDQRQRGEGLDRILP